MWKEIIFILFYFLRFGSAITIDNCPSTVIRDKYLALHNNKCYYFYIKRYLHYEEAVDFCIEKGGSLVLVKSEDTNEFLRIKLASLFGNVTPKKIWIGLDDFFHEKHFRWVDGSAPEYVNVDRSFRLDLTNKEQLYGRYLSCMAMNFNTGKWTLEFCRPYYLARQIKVHPRPFVCEFQGVQRTRSPYPFATKSTDYPSSKPKTKIQDATTSETPKETTRKPQCPPTQSCELDCGMDGYRTDPVTGCFVCDCKHE